MIGRLTSITSCYIGDVAARHKKKSEVLPTLVVNLRTEAPLSSSRSFRRRSHDLPGKENARKEGTGKETLLFRPPPDSREPLDRWSREIQSYLVPSSSYSGTTANSFDPTFRQEYGSSDEAPASSSSLFFINGEPSTALLSPSLRSQASNLSSIDSDDNGSLLSSVVSEMALSRMDGEAGRPSSMGRRSSLQIATRLRHPIGLASPEILSPTVGSAPARRETILDRFFSTTPTSPSMGSAPVPMGSIARFEALIKDMESGRVQPPDDSFLTRNYPPKRIPSPTQRALEYVSTGFLGDSSGSSYGDAESSQRSSMPFPEDYAPRKKLGSILSEGFGLSRQASETSLGTTASMAGSIGAASLMEAQSLGVSSGKRHSLADLSAMKIAPPPAFQLAASSARRGSYPEIPRSSEPYGDAPPPLAARDFSNHPRVVTRPHFREFSF